MDARTGAAVLEFIVLLCLVATFTTLHHIGEGPSAQYSGAMRSLIKKIGGHSLNQ